MVHFSTLPSLYESHEMHYESLAEIPFNDVVFNIHQPNICFHMVRIFTGKGEANYKLPTTFPPVSSASVTVRPQKK